MVIFFGLNPTSTRKQHKIDKWEFIKSMICTAKETIKCEETICRKWSNGLAIFICPREGDDQNIQETKARMRGNPINKWAAELNWLVKEDIETTHGGGEGLGGRKLRQHTLPTLPVHPQAGSWNWEPS